MYYFVSAPLVFTSLPFAIVNEWRTRKLSPLLALALLGVFANFLLFFNYSTTVNWRYFLTGLPAIVPLSANYLIRSLTTRLQSLHRAVIVTSLIIVGLAGVFGLYIRPVSRDFVNRRALSKTYREQLAKVPPDAVMISGSQTVAVSYWKAIGAGQWETIGTGGGWPGDQFISTVERYLKEDRRVFVDTDLRWWWPCGWQKEEIPSIVSLEQYFRFRRVTDTIYEVRPLADESAHDHPSLIKLLPANRPEDVKKCPVGR
jgi:hypothetical protein